MILQKNNKWSLDGHWQFLEKSHPDKIGMRFDFFVVKFGLRFLIFRS
jgi:hypothetical protein